MGNIIGTLISGFIKSVASLFGAPIDFLSGKACSAACGSTWDLVCYVENFCIVKLLKLASVLALFYIVLLFFYLLHKTGIFHCIGRSLCKMTWACLATCFSSCEHASMFLWFKMKNIKHIEEQYSASSSEEDLEESISYRHTIRPSKFRNSLSHRAKERRRMQLDRSLRPRSRRINVGISHSSVLVNERSSRNHSNHVHNIKVTRTSKFARSGSSNRISHRRW